MIYKLVYKTPKDFADILLYSDGEYLTRLYFENSKDSLKQPDVGIEKNLPVFTEAIRWLDIYFSGKQPDFTPAYKITNISPFGQEVIEIMKQIPFGQVISYNNIAKKLAQKRGIARMSAQAVGGAVGRNPICIIIPCHRVVGAQGNLTGYGGGMQNKIALLKLEQNDMSQYFVPKKGKVL